MYITEYCTGDFVIYNDQGDINQGDDKCASLGVSLKQIPIITDQKLNMEIIMKPLSKRKFI